MNSSKSSFAFFGSSRLSVIVLDDLFGRGLVPTFIVTTPDKPVGRKQILTENIVKQWAKSKNIPVFDPAKLSQEFIDQIRAENHSADGSEKCPVFLVASYGMIIPQALLDLPSYGSLNIHPSLLPKYRGPAPLPTAILEDTKDTGVTIMKMDAQMDHGPIIAQKNIHIAEWPTYEEFEEMMAKEGASLFAEILPKWLNGEIKEKTQDHSVATYTKKIIKEDGHLETTDNGLTFVGDPYLNFRKIQAYHEWPQAFFFMKHGKRDLRIKITQASFENNTLKIEKVIPEGAKEMSYGDFLRGYTRTV